MKKQKKNDEYMLLFLEGPIQTGKSTLIRRLLKEYFGVVKIGGFTSQRLTDEKGKTVGFRIGAPDDALSQGMKEFCEDPCRYRENGIFKYLGDDRRMHQDHDFFGTFGVRLLSESLSEKPELFLLDEIGGHEMGSWEFREKLYEVLSSGIPCIGVIKSPDNTKKMMEMYSEKAAEIISLNEELHERIEHEFNGKILWFDRTGEPDRAGCVERETEEFLKRVFTEKV